MAIKTLLIHFLKLGVGIASTEMEYADSTSSDTPPTTGWQTTPPKWQDGHYIWTRTHITYTNGKETYSAPVCTTGSKGDKGDPGKDGADGEDGQDAVTITMSVPSIVHKKSANSARYTSEIRVYEGNKQVPFQASWPEPVTGLTVSRVLKGDGMVFSFEIKGNAVVNTSVKIVIVYKDVSYVKYIPITTVSDGDKGDPGERGAVLRGPQLWADCGIGYNFEDGGTGMEWKDTVVYNNNTYSCIKSHVKTADNYPGSDEDVNNGYWRVGSPIELIVANIIMSRYQLVKNLGVETIEMRDSAGNVIFQAKDGEVLANKGTFNNVNVSGRFFSRDPRTWNEVEIDANNGGLTMRGPSSVLDDNFDLPSTNATLKDLFKIFYDFDADSLRRLAVLKIFGRDDNDYVKISGNGDLWLSYYSDSVLLTPTGISYTDERTGKNYYKDWSDLLK